MKTKSVLLVALACSLIATWTARADTGSLPNLTGRIVAEQGKPVANATVFIYSAGPKKGAGVTCPYCYPDCQKRAKTDDQGGFKIQSLDTKLLFSILVVSAGHEAKYVNKVDPVSGKPLQVTLNAIPPEDEKSPNRVTGVVMGPDGSPVPGVVIDVNGVQVGDGTHWGGTRDYVEPVTVSDEKGFFALHPKTDEVKAIHAVAEGPALAKRWVTLKAGRDHLVRMQEGVTVTGRIVQNGKPLKDVGIAMSTRERECGKYYNGFETTTDSDGRFLLANIPPENAFNLYSKMDMPGVSGALPLQSVQTGATETRIALGDLQVGSAHRVSGHVVLSDGKRIPADTKISISREDAWDHVETDLGKDGEFTFTGVPSESVGLYVRVKGYKCSKKNKSLDWLNGGLMGRVTGDIRELTILLDPGDWQLNGNEGTPPGGESQPREKPLHGAEFSTAASR